MFWLKEQGHITKNIKQYVFVKSVYKKYGLTANVLNDINKK